MRFHDRVDGEFTGTSLTPRKLPPVDKDAQARLEDVEDGGGDGTGALIEMVPVQPPPPGAAATVPVYSPFNR